MNVSYKNAVAYFRTNILPGVVVKYGSDKAAQREAWGEYIDSLCKSGQITQKQYDEWGSPIRERSGRTNAGPKPVTFKRVASKTAKARKVLGDVHTLLSEAPETSGKTGGNAEKDLLDAIEWATTVAQVAAALADRLRAKHYKHVRDWKRPVGATAHGPAEYAVREALGFGHP